MNQKIGQLFLIGISGTELTSEEANFIVKNNIGGVVLFARNLDSPEQIYNLCSEIQSLHLKTADKLPLFIGIDMEGGRVHRLKKPFTRWPSLAELNKTDSSSMAFKFAMAMGTELRAVGINLNFAPCIDILTNPKNELIGDRSISSDPEQVSKIASALVRGYVKADIVSCAKHFPGHGNTIIDSHEDLPVESVDLETLRERELLPFKKAFRARLDMVMTAHIKFENIDPKWPVTLSEKFLKDIARDELRYSGLIISDDLDMKALSKNYSTAEIPCQALRAGCDLLLYCNEPDSPKIAIEAVKEAAEKDSDLFQHINESYKRIVTFKDKKFKNYKQYPFEVSSKVIGHPEHLEIVEAIKNGETLTE